MRYVLPILIMAIVLLPGCSGPSDEALNQATNIVHTVQWYIDHPDERKARQLECKDLGMMALEDKDCLAASQASKQVMMRGFSDRGEPVEPKGFPKLQ